MGMASQLFLTKSQIPRYDYKGEHGNSLRWQYRSINTARKFSLTVCGLKYKYINQVNSNFTAVVGRYKIYLDVDYNS